MPTKKADKQAIRKANETALKGFPKSKLRKAFDAMAADATAADNAAESKAAAALNVVELAAEFRTANADIDTATVVKGWRDNFAVLTMELATAGNRFAELKPGKDGQPATAKLTGYGNNVMSIGKGVIEFDIEPGESYRETRVAVEAARREARRKADPDAALLEDAKAEAIANWDELRTLIFETGDAGLVSSLADTLASMHADAAAALAKQAEAEADDDAEPEAAAA